MDLLQQQVDLSEGDCNLGQHRKDYIDAHDAKTRALLERDEKAFVRQALSTPCLNALERAEGVTLTDTTGHELLDFHGNAVHQLGFAHPEIIDAVKSQLDKLSFCPRRYTNEPAIELAERLGEIVPVTGDGPGKVLFAPSGSLGMSTALKLARLTTGRYKTISMAGSFHGAGMDTISIGGDAIFREGLGPLMPGSIHVPAYCEDDSRQSIDLIESILQKDRLVGAVVAEPMRWTTLVTPPPWYWQRLRALCDRYGALLIFDEIPSCLGRTGKLFCAEHTGIRPDVIVIGKGLGGGIFPMAAMVADAGLKVPPNSALGHYTHEKSPVGAAAALATIKIIAREQLADRAEHLGHHLAIGLERLSERYDVVQEARGLGLHRAIQLDTARKDVADVADRLLYACLRRGLSLKISAGSIVTLSPPLTITREQIDRAVDILDRALEASI